MKLILALILVGCIAFTTYIEIQNLVVRQFTWSFISGNWVSLLSFAFSSISLYIATVGYRYRTRAQVKIDTSGSWDFDLQTETLETGDTTAIAVTKTGTKIESFIENFGGCATTLKKLEIIKKRGLLKKSQGAEVIWRRDFTLAQTDREGKLIQLSIWDRIEPGQRLKLILPYMLLLDLMVAQSMLDLNDRFQGPFRLAIKHVYGEAKSSEFQLFLSEALRSFISDRVDAFGRIIARD